MHLFEATLLPMTGLNCHSSTMKVMSAGPSHPYTKDGVAAGFKNHRTGFVEDAHLSDFHFDDQYNTFHR